MPEGPEIRRAADKISQVLEGKTVETVKFGQPKLRHFARQLRGHRILRVETRGKAMLTHFEHGLSIYSHNQLYGVWRVVRGHKLPQSKRTLRLLLQTDQDSAILYSASDISVWPTAELPEHPFLARIGPDIMNPDLGWRDIVARLDDPRFARKRLGALHLDQAFLAGTGNYLRSEILHDARLHHEARPMDLTRGEKGRLARSTLVLSRRSYDTGGLTVKPALAKQLHKQGLKRGQRRFYVFGRQGLPCYGCGGKVKKVDVGTRRLYFCPACQPASGA